MLFYNFYIFRTGYNVKFGNFRNKSITKFLGAPGCNEYTAKYLLILLYCYMVKQVSWYIKADAYKNFDIYSFVYNELITEINTGEGIVDYIKK